MKDIRAGMKNDAGVMDMISSGLSHISDGLSHVSDELSTLAGIVESGFEELKWEMEQQTRVLLSIDQTLKTPTQTQAREWRQMAEQLRTRGCFDEAEQWFLKSLELNPLDFRTYVGFALNYLRKNDFDKAEEVLKNSLPHAPQGTLGPSQGHKQRNGFDDMTREELQANADDIMQEGGYGQKKDSQVTPFNYRSLSHRLIGRIYACRGDYGRATAELRSAIDLSPSYPEGNYDYALYCVQAGKATGWDEQLRRAISARPGYLNVARVERRFSPARQELKILLSGILTDAYRNAQKTIQEAEVKVAEAQSAVANAPNAGSYRQQVNALTTQLATAKDDLASKDYLKLLKAHSDATRITTLGCSLTQEARGASEVFRGEKRKRENEAVGKIPLAIVRAAMFGVVLGGLFAGVGCVAAITKYAHAPNTPDYIRAYAGTGWYWGLAIGISLGVILDIWNFTRVLAGKSQFW